LSRGRAATSSSDDRGFCRASYVRCCVFEIVLDLIVNIMINVQESLLSIMITRNLWSTRVWVRDWLCRGKRRHPQCTLSKVSCIVVWLFFSKSGFYLLVFSKVQGRSLFMRKSLPIGLNPNRSKVWILASYFYVLYL